MANYSVNKVGAFATRTAGLFTRNKPALQAKGYNATADIAKLIADAAALPTTDEAQEHAKSMQRDATLTVNSDTHDAYLNASGVLKTASGFLGKKGVEADEAKRIRGQVSNQDNPSQVATFVTSTAAYLTTHKTALIAKNYDPTAKITELTALAGTLSGTESHQEGMKGERGDATVVVLAATDALYVFTNDRLEATSGFFATDSEFNKEVRRIRKEFYGGDSGTPPPPPPPPTPPPTP